MEPRVVRSVSHDALIPEFTVHILQYEVVLEYFNRSRPRPHEFLIVTKNDAPESFETQPASFLHYAKEIFGHVWGSASSQDEPASVLHFSVESDPTKDTAAVQTLRRLGTENSFLAYGLLGAIRLVSGTYLVVVENRAVVGELGGIPIYSLLQAKAVACFNTHKIKNHDKRYLSLLESIFPSMKGFYFSYQWDLTRTFQKQLLDSRKSQGRTEERGCGPQLFWPVKPPSLPDCEERFLFNAYLIKSLQKMKGSFPLYWVVPMIQGCVAQTELRVSKRTFSFTVVARRSRHHAGPRYFKRGINESGRVANELECEQIVSEKETGSKKLEKSISVGAGKIFGVGSFVMVRGSLPIFWGNKRLSVMKPKIELYSDVDKTFDKTIEHFTDLLKRYGWPIIVLDLVKQAPLSHPEARLSIAFREAIGAVQERLSSERSSPESALCCSTGSFSSWRRTGTRFVYYEDFDWITEEKEQGFNVAFQKLVCLASGIVDVLGVDAQWIDPHANNRKRGVRSSRNEPQQPPPIINQEGTVRINCVDCVDRTNLGMLALGFEALKRHLVVFGCMDELMRELEETVSLPPLSSFSSPSEPGERRNAFTLALPVKLVKDVTDVWVTVGDQISNGYTGSGALHKPFISSLESSLCSKCLNLKPYASLGNIVEERFLNEEWEFFSQSHPIHQKFDLSIQVRYKRNSDIYRSFLQKLDGAALTRSGAVGSCLSKGREWKAVKTSNIKAAVKRYLHSLFNDSHRQRALDVLLGNLEPQMSDPLAWEADLQSNRETRRALSPFAGQRAPASRYQGSDVEPREASPSSSSYARNRNWCCQAPRRSFADSISEQDQEECLDVVLYSIRDEERAEKACCE